MQTDPISQPIKIGPHSVPGVWRYMLPEDLHYFRFPNECKSTCSNCPKIEAENFHPDYRCCTYNPRIPNFLLGLALEDSKTAPLIEKVIEDGFATPDGLQQTPLQMRDSLAQNSGGHFGKDAKVVCRFLDMEKKGCRLYAYRNSVCATFFCINDDGPDGRHFWESLQSLAGQVEVALGQWTMENRGISARDYMATMDSFADSVPSSVNPNTKAWSQEFLDKIWGCWRGKEREFFIQCANDIKENKEDLLDLAQEVEILQPTAFEIALREGLPPELKRELDSEGPTHGTPVPIEDLWYLLQKAHHNIRTKQ